MKYLKLMLIPLITFMFMVPTKAQETPDWVYTDNYYVVYETVPSGTLVTHIISSKNNLFIHKSGSYTSLVLPVSNYIESYRLDSDSDTWVGPYKAGGNSYNINGVQHKEIYRVDNNNNMLYSNFDVYTGGELFFPKTPVATLAMVTQQAVETLSMEVQGTSGTISLVGGVILGTLLVTLLVSRLRYWVRV